MRSMKRFPSSSILVGSSILTGAAVLLASLPASAQPPVPAHAPGSILAQLASPAHKSLIDEIWQIVDQRYIDPSFNGQDWSAVRQQLLEQTFSSDAALYQSIQERLSSLGDPLTRFLPPDEFKAMQIEPGNSESVGIGLQFSQDPQTRELVVFSAIEGSPAQEAEILPGDVLVNINGTDVSGKETSAALTLLRGSVGTPVTVIVQRGQSQLEFNVTRRPVEIRPVSYARQDSPIGAIGYIRLVQFSASASESMREAIRDLESQGVKGYVLDLRHNPGGLLYAGIDVARLWIDEGAIVSTRDREGSIEEERANGTAMTDKLLVVLVNSHSTSASEILAGALQDNRRALLVGTETAGRNSIQSIRRVGEEAGLAVTVAKWYPPSGRDIDRVGLAPDVRVVLTAAQEQNLFQAGRGPGSTDDPYYTEALKILAAAP